MTSPRPPALRVRGPASVVRATARPPGPAGTGALPHAQSQPPAPRPQGNGRGAMTSRGPGRASRTLEMEEKELLRRQIRLLQGRSGRAGVAPSSFPSLHGGPSPASRRGSLSARGLDGQVWWVAVGSGSGWGAGGASRPAGSAPCLGFARRTVRDFPALRRGAAGQSLSNRREAAPTPTGGRVLGVPRPLTVGREALVRRGKAPTGEGSVFLPCTPGFDPVFLCTVTLPLIVLAQASLYKL